jgi:SnoaL-like domain
MDDREQALADKAEIVELMTRYCFAVDFRDFERLRDVFAADADATYVLSPLGLGLDDVHLSGADAIVEWLSSVLGNLGEPAPRHAMTNFLIEVDGDRAHSRNYLASGGGLYTVEHVRTPDGWRAAKFEMRNFARPATPPG